MLFPIEIRRYGSLININPSDWLAPTIIPFARLFFRSKTSEFSALICVGEIWRKNEGLGSISESPSGYNFLIHTIFC